MNIYEPPIRLIYNDISREMTEQFNEALDKEVLKAVCSVGIDIDKDALEQALFQDRQRYELSYWRGMSASRNRGEWIPVQNDGDTALMCSVCNNVMHTQKKWDFCPNCGAILKQYEILR